MYIIQGVFQFVVNAFVAVGDSVIALLTSPRLLLKKSKPKKKLKSGTFHLKKKPKKKVIFKFNLKPFVNLVKGAASLLIFPFKAAVYIPLWLISALQKRSQTRRMEKLIQKKRDAKVKNGYHKPGVFYKLKYVFIGFLFSFIFLFLPLVSLIFLSDLPNPSNLSVNYIPKTTKIYDRNNTLLYEIYANQNRTVVKLSDVPDTLRQATVAVEDKDFYSHPGFDLRGMVRALVTNVSKKGFQGGSTITQQLIKSAFLTSDPTVVRKIKEVALAFWAERVYSKDEILEFYLNYVPYGGTAWGAESASEIYFGKRVKDLNLAESAFLAGLPQSPSAYSPFVTNGGAWKKRQKEVLDAMVRQGYISRPEADSAYKEDLSFKSPKVPLRAPHFVMYVRKILEDRYGISEVERGGLTVRTTIDIATQEAAEKIVKDKVEEDAYLNIGNGAALITTPGSGDILAMVGSRDYFDEERDGNVNLTTALRQPGSSIKLVTYTLALSEGYTEATILDDSALTIYSPGGPSYTPVNYDGAFHGKVPLRTAFANSYNIPPVRLVQKFGADKVKEFGEKMGIYSWDNVRNYGASITLGGVELRMTELSTAYGVIANGGKRVDLDPLLEVHDSHGQTIYKKAPKKVEIVDPGIAFIISDILADNNARSASFGPNSALNIPGVRVSVKTGTTDNKRDNWTVGFTPDVLISTWVGNNDNAPLNPALASGVTGAAPMWNQLMTMMLEKTGSASAAIVPPSVIKKYCVGMDRYFVRGTENSVSCRFVPPVSPSLSPTE